jgi:hypothetical protein
MGEGKTSLQKHLSQVMQAQLITEAPQDSEQDNIRREFKVVERGASPLIKSTAAVRAEECRVTEFGLFRSLPGGGSAVRGSSLVNVPCSVRILRSAYQKWNLCARMVSEF